MVDQEEINTKEQLLATYRLSLRHLLHQQEQYRTTGYVPLIVINDIYNAREQIRLLKEQLRGEGVLVEDQDADGSPSGEPPPCPYPGIQAFTAADSPYFFWTRARD